MASRVTTWIVDCRQVYFGNATAVRDYRVQLRGNRSAILFGVYLALMIGVAIYTYANITSTYGSSVVSAQAGLHEFYTVTMGLLGLFVALVAPGLTATTIAMERQRRSIDLVFSAPVSAKYYLVGKMISSFRYTWMVLALSLPVTAASVVLGGATWFEVLEAYILLSLQGLILTGISLLISALTPRPVAAIIWSYLTAIALNIVAATASFASTFAMFGSARRPDEIPFWAAFSPFTLTAVASSYTIVGQVHFPNWVLVLGSALLIVKICLVGAACLLNPAGKKEVVKLRLHVLVYLCAFFGMMGQVQSSSISIAGAGAFTPYVSRASVSGRTVMWMTMFLIIFVPFIACYGFDKEIRYRPNGLLRLRNLLDGTPAGGLPFLAAMLLAVFGSFALGVSTGASSPLGIDFWVYGLFALCFWSAFWSIGRVASLVGKTVAAARTYVFAAFLLLVVLPYPFLVVAAGAPNENQADIWLCYVLSPLITTDASTVGRGMMWSVILLAFSLALLAYSEPKIRSKMSKMRNYDEQPV